MSSEESAKTIVRVVEFLVIGIAVVLLIIKLALPGKKQRPGEDTEPPADDDPEAEGSSPGPAASETAGHTVRCPHCQRGLKAKPALAGKTVRCPACKQPFVVKGD